MKQKDIALIAVVVIVAVVASFLLSNMLFAPKDDRQQQVEKVDKITAEFPEADKKYFNDKAIDPTQQIQIQDNGNDDPFSSTAQ